MNLQSQVTSLELSKRLRDLGVPQKSLFYWKEDTNQLIYADETNIYEQLRLYSSAFTVAELGDMLKDELMPEWCKGKWEGVVKHASKLESVIFRCDTEADARAKMLAYLLKHG